MKYILGIGLILIGLGCTSKKEQYQTKPDSAEMITDSIPAVTEKQSDTEEENTDLVLLKSYLAKAEEMQNDLLRDLRDTTLEEADSIYLADSFRFDQTIEFMKLDSVMLPVLERWSRAHSASEDEDQDIEIFNLLEEIGLEPEYISEGYTELKIKSHYYYELFQPYVTTETEQFMKISSDHDTLISSDGGLIVSLDTLLTRCIDWEKFLDRCPQSVHTKKVIAQYGMYMQLILFCNYDNTPTFNRYTNRIEDWVLEELQDLKDKYPDTKTNYILEKYLTELKQNHYRYSKAFENKIMNIGLLKEWDKESVYF